MALGTFSNVKRNQVGNRWLVTGTYTPANPTGASGDAITAAALKSIGLGSLDVMVMQSLHGNSGANVAGIAWRRGTDGKGTIHIYDMLPAHTHDVLALGGLTSSEPLFLDASQSFGKTAATNRTIVGSTSATTGGVRPNVSAAVVGARATAADYSSYKSEFFAIGRGA